MGLNRIGILHIPDLHFGSISELIKSKKGLPISEQLQKDMGSDDPKELFLNRVSFLLRNQEVDVIAFTGDAGLHAEEERLTLNSMGLGIEYLSKLKDRFNIPSDRVVIAPGNHDLNRRAPKNDEFLDFITKCKDQGFSVATRTDPALITVKGVPFIAINTCLGGTEQAYYGLPVNFWQVIKELITKLETQKDTLTSGIIDKIPEEVQHQLKAMDIPAVGDVQLNKILESFISIQGNCAVVLGHHNLLPTNRVVIRPFAELLDSGRIIFNLINDGRRLVFLHGHTHCETSLSLRSPEANDTGFMLCLGGNGLHTINQGASASATYIQLFVDDNNDFLCAIISRLQQRGTDFIKDKSFIVWDNSSRVPPRNFSVQSMDLRTVYTLDELSRKYGYTSKEDLAAEIMRYRSYHQFEINDMHKPIEDWTIIRNV